MFLIDNLLNIPKLQITCNYHTYFKNYRLLNTMAPNKMLIKEEPFHFENKHVHFTKPSMSILQINKSKKL